MVGFVGEVLCRPQQQFSDTNAEKDSYPILILSRCLVEHVFRIDKHRTNDSSCDQISIEALLEDAREFLASEAWYTERGIPYRRGYLLHGVPGGGRVAQLTQLTQLGWTGLDFEVSCFQLAPFEASKNHQPMLCP